MVCSDYFGILVNRVHMISDDVEILTNNMNNNAREESNFVLITI